MKEQANAQEICTLAQLSRGTRALLYAIQGTASESKHLLIMGLRPGSEITVLLGPDRRGLVLASAGTRIALGREWLERIQVRQTPHSGRD